MHEISTDTVTEGEPISNRRARREQFKRTIATLAERFPTCFIADKSKPHRPLKIGIHAVTSLRRALGLVGGTQT